MAISCLKGRSRTRLEMSRERRRTPLLVGGEMKQQELAERYPHLAEMADGDPELMLDLLEMFLVQTPALMQKLEEALHPLERSSVYAASHTLKPTLRPSLS